MAIINFAIPEALEFRVKETVKQKGFSSKAELFRFALLRYLDELHQPKKLMLEGNTRIADLVRRLEKELEKVDLDSLPPLKEQWKRLERL